jgi:hypothetical protein
MSELENSKDKKERDEFNEIEKELENREWGSVINAPLSEVESTVDELVEKEKSMPNGFGSFIEKADATETKEVAKKYSGEVSKADAKKDFDKAFNGSPSTWYADALKLKESVRVFIEQGGTFKELLQGQATEYTKDGFTEEEAASVIGRKLEDIKRQTDKSQQESQVKPDVSTTESKDVVTPEILEQGKKEVTDVTKGTFSTANPVKIFKGIGGKKDLQGFRINAHKGAKGVFSSVDSELAATYGRDEGVAEVVIPKGTSIEVVEVDGTGMGMSDYRAAEVKAINNSDAQIVKLITIDGVMKAGEKRQQQYVIKDDSLIEGLKKEESPTSTKDDIEPVKAPPEDGNIRRFAQRASEIMSKKVGEKERDAILQNPESYYEKQTLKEIKEDLSGLTDAELVSKMTDDGLASVKEGDDNVSGLAAAELINRRIAKGQGIEDIVEATAKKGTSSAQFMRQLAEIKSSTPLGMYSYLEKQLDKEGLMLTDEQKATFLKISQEYLADTQKWKKSYRNAGENPSKENQAIEQKLRETAEASSKVMNNFMQDVIPKSMWQMAGMTVQGNLLTPMSQATNIWANLLQLPLRVSSEAIATIADRISSFLMKSPRVNNPTLASYARATKEVPTALKKSAGEIVGGVQGEIAKGEIQQGFRPLRSFLQLIGNDNLPVSQKTGKTPKKIKFQKAYESLFGIAPEAMFRMLRLGDNIFRMPVKARALYEYGKNKGLKGKDLENFIKYPDSESEQRAEQRSKEAVFMEDSVVSDLANKIMTGLKAKEVLSRAPIIGKELASAWEFILRLQVPYVKTPSNIISQTVDFAFPVIPMGKSALYYKVAKDALSGKSYDKASSSARNAHDAAKRKANIEFGKAATGAILVSTAAWLVSNGLVSEGISDDDERERNLKYQTFPPSSINVSGVERAMNGGNPDVQGGDVFISLSKMGIAGMVFGIYAQKNKADVKESQKVAVAETADEKISREAKEWVGLPSTILSFAMEQSFLSGVSSLLDAVAGGNVDNWMKNTFKALTSIPLPNTLAAINRAEREHLPDLRSKSILKQLENVVRDKTFNTDGLPVRVDYFGRDIKQTPEGREPWIYQMIDVTKGRVMTDDPVDNAVFDLYKETQDSKVIPNMMNRDIREGGRLLGAMTPEQFREVNKLLGELRYEELSKLISRSSYQKANPEEKAKKISSKYSKVLNSSKVKKLVEKIKKEMRNI